MTEAARVDTNRLRKAMRDSGESATSLARRAGLSKGTVIDTINGRRQTRPATVERVAAQLKVPASSLYRD